MAFTTSLFLVKKRGKFLAVGTRQVDEIGGQKNDYQGSSLLGCKLRTAAVVGPPAGDFDGSPTPNARATAGAIFIRGQSRTVYSIRLKKKEKMRYLTIECSLDLRLTYRTLLAIVFYLLFLALQCSIKFNQSTKTRL